MTRCSGLVVLLAAAAALVPAGMANTSKVPVDPCTETLGMLKSAKYACWAKGSDKFCDKASGCNKLLSELNAGCKDKTILATAKKDTDMAMKNCPTFDPCAKTKPGEKCSLCETGDKKCVETKEIKTCQKGKDGSVKCKSYTELKKGITDFTKAGKVTKAFTLATTDLNSVAVKPSNDTSKVKSYSNNIKDMFRELRKADKANKAINANDKSATIERKDLKRKLLDTTLANVQEGEKVAMTALDAGLDESVTKLVGDYASVLISKPAKKTAAEAKSKWDAKAIVSEVDIDMDTLEGVAICEHQAVDDVCSSAKDGEPYAKSKMASTEEGKVDTFKVSCWDAAKSNWKTEMAKETGDEYSCDGKTISRVGSDIQVKVAASVAVSAETAAARKNIDCITAAMIAPNKAVQQSGLKSQSKLWSFFPCDLQNQTATTIVTSKSMGALKTTDVVTQFEKCETSLATKKVICGFMVADKCEKGICLEGQGQGE